VKEVVEVAADLSCRPDGGGDLVGATAIPRHRGF